MKEIEDFKKERVEITQEKKDRQEEKFIGRVHLNTGCSLWAYDPENDTMKVAKIAGSVNIGMDGKSSIDCRAQYNPRFLYFQATKEKTARKKLGMYRAGNWKIAEDFKPKEFLKLNFFR